MNQNLFIFIFCIVLVSCTEIDRAKTVQITPKSAAEIISSHDPLLYQVDTLNYQENDSIYSLLFIDPDIVNDPNLDHVTTITLSYTFFPSEDQSLVGKTKKENAS